MANFDSYSPEFINDPYPTFARLRAESPFFYDEKWSLTFFTRHADVHALLRDKRFGRDVRHAVAPEDIDIADHIEIEYRDYRIVGTPRIRNILAAPEETLLLARKADELDGPLEVVVGQNACCFHHRGGTGGIVICAGGTIIGVFGGRIEVPADYDLLIANDAGLCGHYVL